MTTTFRRERPVLEAARRAILAAPRPLLPMRRRTEFEQKKRRGILDAATRLTLETMENGRRTQERNR